MGKSGNFSFRSISVVFPCFAGEIQIRVFCGVTPCRLESSDPQFDEHSISILGLIISWKVVGLLAPEDGGTIIYETSVQYLQVDTAQRSGLSDSTSKPPSETPVSAIKELSVLQNSCSCPSYKTLSILQATCPSYKPPSILQTSCPSYKTAVVVHPTNQLSILQNIHTRPICPTIRSA